jgi:uncharacterized membrane protein YfcA
MTLVQIVVIFAVMGIGAALQGSVGYGMGLIASPILILISPRLIPGPFALAATLLISLMIVREKQALDFFGLRWAIIGLIPGTLIGSWILVSIDTSVMVLLFALLILVIVGLSYIGLHLQANRLTLGVAGLFSGVMGILTTVSGPLIALIYQDTSGPRLRATMSGFFIAGCVISIASLIMVGRMGVQEIQLSLLLIPGMLFGFLISSRVLPWVDRGYTRSIVLSLAALSAIFIIIKQIW